MLQVNGNRTNGRRGKKTAAPARVTMAELARMRGVSRQAITKQVAELERDGLIEVTVKGRKKLVDVAAFEKARAAIADPARAHVVKAKPVTDAGAGDAAADKPAAPMNDYQSARAERERTELELARLKLDRERGTLVPVADVERAVTACAGKLMRLFMSAADWSDEILSIAAKGDVDQVRAFLRGKAVEQREQAGREMAALFGDDGGEE